MIKPPARTGTTEPDLVRVMLLTLGTITLLYFGSNVLQPLALAILLAMILTPPVKALETRGVPRVAASLLTIGAALAVFAVAMMIVLNQVGALAADFGNYKTSLLRKLKSGASQDGVVSQLTNILQQSADTIRALLSTSTPQVDVRIVADPVVVLSETIAPYLSFFGTAFVVLILMTFLLIRREDMSDRIVGLFGQERIGITTRALDETGDRVSSYLSAFTAVNAIYGLVLGAGLWAIGIPLAVLWGVLAGLLRFIPYIGAVAGIVGPLLLAMVISPGWLEPLAVLALFACVEVLLVAVAEPLIYGKSTGVSPVGLLVAATFWTWLWGPIGLLLSTPLTVSLAVAGKYVPALRALALVLGEKSGIAPHLQLYQRLLGGEAAEARLLLDEALAAGTMAQAFDLLLAPLLAKCAADYQAGTINLAERTAVWRQLDDLLDELEWKGDVSMQEYVAGREYAGAGRQLVGIAWTDAGDLLILRMLNLLLAPWGQRVLAIGPGARDAQTPDLIAGLAPAAVLLTHFPPADNDALASFVSALIRHGGVPVVIDARWNSALRSTHPLAGRVVQAGSLGQACDIVLGALQSAAEAAVRLRSALMAGDTELARDIYARAQASMSMERLCCAVLEPMLAAQHTSGLDDPRQPDPVADFVLDALRPVATSVRSYDAGARRAILACPDCAREDAWLIMLAVTLRERGWDVLYLGTTIDHAHLPDVSRRARPDLIILHGASAGIDCASDALGAPQWWSAHSVMPAGAATAGCRQLPPTIAQAMGALDTALLPAHPAVTDGRIHDE
jgi:predicted PurR-regulated permease PerM